MNRLTATEQRDFLTRVPIFSKLAGGELDALLGLTRTRSVATRQEVFHKGDEGDQVFVILRGRLKVLSTSEDGGEVVFGIMDPGEVVGELALLSGERRTATLTAIEPCELLVIERRDFLPFLSGHPEVAAKLLEVLAERLRRVDEFVEDTLFLKLPSRLAKKLLSLSRSYGEKTAGGIRVNIKLSQQELGELVGASRESVNRELRRWVEQGVLSVDGGYVTIHDGERLESLASFAPL